MQVFFEGKIVLTADYAFWDGELLAEIEFREPNNLVEDYSAVSILKLRRLLHIVNVVDDIKVEPSEVKIFSRDNFLGEKYVINNLLDLHFFVIAAELAILRPRVNEPVISAPVSLGTEHLHEITRIWGSIACAYQGPGPVKNLDSVDTLEMFGCEYVFDVHNLAQYKHSPALEHFLTKVQYLEKLCILFASNDQAFSLTEVVVDTIKGSRVFKINNFEDLKFFVQQVLHIFQHGLPQEVETEINYQTPLLLSYKNPEHSAMPQEDKLKLSAPAITHPFILTFACLGGKTVTEAKISDHNPVLIETKFGRVCTFNILMQCAKGNNGFEREETCEQYQARLLGPVVNVLVELFKVYQVKYFLLQEAPNAEVGKQFYNILRGKLPEIFVDETVMFKAIANNLTGISASGGVFTMFPQELRYYVKDTTEQIKHFVSAGNQKRFQSFYYHDEVNSELLVLANFHGDFDDQSGMQDDLKWLVKGGFIVGGDFNLLAMPDLGVPSKGLLTDPAMKFPYRTYDGIYNGHDGLNLLNKISYRFCCC